MKEKVVHGIVHACIERPPARPTYHHKIGSLSSSFTVWIHLYRSLPATTTYFRPSNTCILLTGERQQQQQQQQMIGTVELGEEERKQNHHQNWLASSTTYILLDVYLLPAEVGLVAVKVWEKVEERREELIQRKGVEF